VITGLLAFVFGCGQEGVIFPDSGTCEIDCETDTSVDASFAYPPGPYGIAQGKTFPKVSWSSRLNREDVVFTSQEAYEQRDEKKALVIVVSARNCPACAELIMAISPKEAEYESVAVMVGMCFTELGGDGEDLTLNEAEIIMLFDDQWPEKWFITNEHGEMPSDAEEGFPSVTVVRLSDMEVIEDVTIGFYIAEKGAEQLLDKIRDL
jgi:hypothetical protein